MNFVDHSRGHTPAKKGDYARWNVTLYHNVCGKPIRNSYSGYECTGPCRGGWHPNVMAHFDDDAMATRFHIRAEIDACEYVIVWKVDEFSHQQYSTIVRKSDAVGLERFVL